MTNEPIKWRWVKARTFQHLYEGPNHILVSMPLKLNEAGQRRANLIAAAPDLLAACEAAIPMLVLAAHESRKGDDFEAAQRYSDTAELMSAAIAKARGQS